MDSDKMEIDEVGDSTIEEFTQDQSVQAILDVLELIAKTTTTLDTRYIWRGLKELSPLRKSHLNQSTLSALIHVLYPDTSSFKIPLLTAVNENIKTSVNDSDKTRESYPAAFYQVINNKTIEVSSEINSFIHLLVQVYLLDSKKFETLSKFNKNDVLPNVLNFYNQRSLDLINAKLWFYIVICDESIPKQFNDNSISFSMTKYLKTASLKHDNETRAMLINLILRNYLKSGEVESAADFVSKVDYPTNDVSSPLEARYYFYLSKIYAIQLDYSSANEYIIAAGRKAPNNSKSLGFLQQVNKLRCCIDLLMGDIPELSFFNQMSMQKSLTPYYHISKAVKLGDLKKFTSTIATYKQQLIKDGNYQLCVRLRSNVIKTGIRIISLTYKKISLKDICIKLNLDSEQTVEYMISRAIRDGVLEAKINHKLGYIETTELLNVYGTNEPQDAFDERIKFVNQLHDESLLAMRYPASKKTNKDKDNNELLDDELLDGLSDFSDLEDLGFL
ncbi:hypothetical protein TBLA_0F02860 [Henningerozyma blattae CBS 6284]|uniref:PCI domain-containing protein n=1 Tax=Henningerozyma blattae (strain ATCC 34711 / CBS 6284 / DSM 70876 / NBRC 10599 / NRRL Y-10934 / UCD 77-7) TaxID=1071380 RepID=I2H623_HENB6|nr:hypothetical protein TBLA_0F02860 [Tetrapisispora blattae CBS 6284]CCH61825.1 hypothetical protein TBLA_0F02860 [Tetrapisispora blattae CBS 6284]